MALCLSRVQVPRPVGSCSPLGLNCRSGKKPFKWIKCYQYLIMSDFIWVSIVRYDIRMVLKPNSGSKSPEKCGKVSPMASKFRKQATPNGFHNRINRTPPRSQSMAAGLNGLRKSPLKLNHHQSMDSVAASNGHRNGNAPVLFRSRGAEWVTLWCIPFLVDIFITEIGLVTHKPV